jgi:prefoldin subunit 5
MYRRQDWQTAWTRRHTDLQELTGVNEQLDEVDRRANELNRRAMALLDSESDIQQSAADVT